MNRLWETFLGIERSPGSAAVGETRLEFASLPQGATTIAVGLLTMALIGLTWWLYRKDRRDLPRPQRALLVGLRLLTLGAVAAILLEPVLVNSRRETLPSHLALVVDDSESMAFSDPYTDESRAAQVAAALKIAGDAERSPIERLRETPRIDLARDAITPVLPDLNRGREVHLYDLETAAGGRLGAGSKSRELSDLKAGRPVSPLGDALQGVLAAHRGRPMAGIVLVSEGRSNAGEDPMRVAESAAAQGVPIYVVAAGAGEGPRNVRVAEVEASPVVFVRDPMTLAAVVEARGLLEAEANLILEQRVNEGAWEPVADQRIVLGEDGTLTRTTFRIEPKVIGQYEYRARVEDAGPELTLDDNEAVAAVRVVRQQIKTLLISGAPTPEVQFLRNALLRDQHVEYSAWLQHADPGYRQAGDRPITRLPDDLEELDEYDALVLVDPDMQALGPNWPEMIRKFVGERGGGLIFVPGELYSQAYFDSEDGASGPDGAGSWTKVLPVVRDPGLFRTDAEVRLSSQTTYPLQLTPEGRGDPIFQFHPDPIRNRTILTSLPGQYWSFPVTRARPGATVLARHGDPRMQNQYGPHVLLDSQLYGPGRTVFLGFDSTYRWRYLSEDYYDGFWARLIDRVGRNKALGGRFPFVVHLGKETYRVGEQVSVGVRYNDPAAVAEASELAAELEVGGAPPEPIAFERSPDDPALLTASFPAEKAGSYTLKVVPATASDLTSGIRASTTTFRVEPPRRELDEPALNRPLLADLARVTGGRVFELDELGDLDDAIATREVTRTLELRDELWDAPLLFATIIAALTAEWVLRKLFRMV